MTKRFTAWFDGGDPADLVAECDTFEEAKKAQLDSFNTGIEVTEGYTLYTPAYFRWTEVAPGVWEHFEGGEMGETGPSFIIDTSICSDPIADIILRRETAT